MGDLEGMDGQTDGWVDGCTYANGKNGERGRGAAWPALVMPHDANYPLRELLRIRMWAKRERERARNSFPPQSDSNFSSLNGQDRR